VCDGFVGNILLKFAEGMGSALAPFLKKQLAGRLKPEEVTEVASTLWQQTNLPRTMGGPLFGVNGPVVLGHGSCKADGVAGAINTAVRYFRLGLLEGMRDELVRMNGEGTLAHTTPEKSPHTLQRK
jgi:glycerol-3-phosphate acyltransferase PlsX